VALDPPLVDTALGRLPVDKAEGVSPGGSVTVLIRPEAARHLAEPAGRDEVVVQGTVADCSFRGGYYRLSLRHDTGLDLSFELIYDARHLPRRGDRVALSLSPEAIGLLVAGETAAETRDPGEPLDPALLP
jgi:ABC-type Fe3+/spermidine/putrescine transport system ATPase subunit